MLYEVITENKTYQEMLQLFYENESCNNFNNILHIEQVVTDKEVVFPMLTLTQQNYIIVKTESFLYEWCNFRRKNYWSLNNNYRLEIWSHKDKSFRFERRMWARFKMQLDAAIVPAIGEKKFPGSTVAGNANFV